MSERINFRLKKLLTEIFFGDFGGLRIGFGGFELEEIRPFREGDPPTAVNPRLSARRGQTMVKVTRPPKGVTAHFMCDFSASMVNKRGTLVSIVEVLADHLSDINAHFACSLVASCLEWEVPPGCGIEHRANLLDLLHNFQPRTRTTSLESMASVLRKIPHPPRLVFVITDLLFAEVGALWRPAVANDIIFCIIREDCEIETPSLWLGATYFVDVETDEEMVGSVISPPEPANLLTKLNVDWQIFSSGTGREEVLAGLVELFEKRKTREGAR